MRDARRIQERSEITLDRTQAVWLSLGGVLAMGAMFALGMVVGRRAANLEMRSPVADDPIAEIQNKEREMHRFYESLTHAAPKEPSKKTEPETETDPSDESVARGGNPVSERPTRAVPAPVERPQGAGDRTETIRTALGAGPPDPGEFTVQVSAFETQPEAKAYAAALERKGFRPFIVRAEVGNRGTWYRVRMGRFDSRRDAQAAKQLLASSDIAAWVLRVD